MLRILPRSQRNVIGFECIGTITAEDYQETLIPAFDRVIAEHGKVRGLLDFTDGFTGFEFQAILKDFRYSSRHFQQIEKFALINAPAWLQIAARVIDALSKCQCRIYAKAERKDAWNFVEE